MDERISERNCRHLFTLLELQTAEVQTEARLIRLARRRFQAAVDWVSAFQWHFWVTLTCGGQASEHQILAHIRKFEHVIRRRGQGRNPFFVYSVEGMPTNPHIHMLLRCRGRRRVGIEDIKRSWRLGFVDVRRYDPAGSAAAYMFKAMRSDARFELWGLSSEFPSFDARADIR